MFCIACLAADVILGPLRTYRLKLLPSPNLCISNTWTEYKRNYGEQLQVALSSS